MQIQFYKCVFPISQCELSRIYPGEKVFGHQTHAPFFHMTQTRKKRGKKQGVCTVQEKSIFHSLRKTKCIELLNRKKRNIPNQ